MNKRQRKKGNKVWLERFETEFNRLNQKNGVRVCRPDFSDDGFDDPFVGLSDAEISERITRANIVATLTLRLSQIDAIMRSDKSGIEKEIALMEVMSND